MIQDKKLTVLDIAHELKEGKATIKSEGKSLHGSIRKAFSLSNSLPDPHRTVCTP